MRKRFPNHKITMFAEETNHSYLKSLLDGLDNLAAAACPNLSLRLEQKPER